MSLMLWNDTLLLGPSGKLAWDVGCCCKAPPCCVPRPPDTLTLEVVSTLECDCMMGLTVTLTYDPIFQGWIGTGPGGTCSALSITWKLTCSNNPDAPPDADNCKHYALAVTGNTSCLAQIKFVEIFAGVAECTCDPFSAEFEFDLLGLSCCDGNFDGHGHITVVVHE